MPHKNSYKYILLGDFMYKKNGVFNDFYVTKSGKPPVSGAVFAYFRQLGGLLASFNSLHHHPVPRHSPANSWRTKQFTNHPHGL